MMKVTFPRSIVVYVVLIMLCVLAGSPKAAHRTPRAAASSVAETVAERAESATAAEAAEDVEAEINLSDYGAIGDGAADDGPALRRALEAVRARGGGVLRVPAGRYAIRTPVSVDFSARPLSLRLLGVPSDTRVDTSFTADVLTRGLHLSSEFYPMTGEAHTALRLSGLASLDVRDLAFVGTPGLFTDAHTTLDFDRVAQATVYHCEFYGLRTEAHGGAIISAARSRLRVEQSMFLGSFGYSALYVPVIQNLEWEDIHVTSTIFADYGQRPGFHGKTQGATFSWVTAGDPAAPTPAAPRREVVIRDVIFDEGAMFGLFAQPSRYRAPAPAIDLILISDLFQNVSNLGTAGTLIYEARGALIERSHYGYSRYTSGAVDLRGVSAAVIDRVECVDSADLIRADAATGQLSVINSVYRDVVSQAAVTRRLQGVADEDDPVWYVRREYAAALGREPEPSEHFYWSQRLLECGDATGGGTGAAACVRAGRAALAAHLAARPAPTFALTGKVTDEGGAPLAGVTVTLMAGAHPLVSARTDERGEYRFDALPTSGDYTVTAAKDYYRMEPEAHALVAPTGGRRADFAAAARTFAVRGRVVTTNNYGFGGVTVTLTGGATGERVTDAEGYFTFAGLAGLRTYTVTPRLAHHTFEAAAHTTGTLVSDQTLSFSGRLNRYGVSGRVVDGRGRAVVGASVTLTGAQAGATTTDAGGRYAFAGLAATSGYTVTVTGAAGTTFTPAARTYASLTGDEAGGDFTALYSIRGRVTEAGTGGGTGGGGTGGTVSGLAGVTMRLSGTQAATTVTDAGGYYAFANLAAGGNYTVTGEAAHYTLTPGGASHAALGAPQVSDFVATRRRHQIAGRVADGAGAALSGVTVTLTATTPGTTTTGTTTTTTTTATTDAAGNYAFANLLAGYNYAVTAARTHYTFSPATLGFNNLGANATAHFTGTLKRYAVGGRVTIATTGAATGAESLPLAGVTVTLTGAHATATATTDAAGNYTFAAVAAGGAYALAAAKAGYALTPARRVVDELTADRAEHFAATLERYELTGRVVNVNNYGLGGIGVRLTGGRGGETQTDAEGYFTFAGVEALGTYTVTPSLRFHTMTPQAQTFAGLTGGQRMSFIARLDSHTVGGRVTEVGGQAVGGVSVTLTDARQPQQPQTTLTDASGNYSFPNLPAGGDYRITASKPGYLLTPPARTVNALEANRTESFIAIPVYSVAGAVTTADGKGLDGVTVALEGAESRTVVTDANGRYSFANIPQGASVTLVPSKKNYIINPAQQTFVVSGNKPDVNFTAAPSPSVVQFSAASYQSNESDAQAVVTIVRTGNTSVESTFTFSTVDEQGQASCLEAGGAASFRCDYAGVVITLTFAPGEMQKTIKIPLIDDAHPERAETLQFRLLNESDSTTVLGTIHTASLTIDDNDNAPAPNPILSTPLFVRMQYLDFLAREPEAGEPWSAVLNNCSDVNNNPLCDRIHVSSSFFNSPEFRLKGLYAFTHYRVAFGRKPVYDEIMPDMRNLTGATEAEVYRKRADLSVDFTERAEFKKLYDALNATAFVNALLDRYALQQITTPDPANPESGAKVVLTRADLIGRLDVSGAQSLTRAQVLRAVAESNEVGVAEYNGAFVAMQYYGYLRRSPDEEGYQAWLKVINQDSNNIRRMIDGFMNSVEYRLRFGQP